MFSLIGVNCCPSTRMNRYWHPAKVWPKDGIPAYPHPFLNFAPSYGFSVSIREDVGSGSSLSSFRVRMSPAVVYYNDLGCVVLFSGLLHLLMRFLIRHPFGLELGVDARTLCGGSCSSFFISMTRVDQAVIDSLPVFQYREIVSLKEPFDRAVCLCAFCEKDKMRLFPVCRHAFHISCIDTWLLSNSTCPLCRRALFASGLAIENPIFYFDDLQQYDELPGNGDNGSSVIPSQKAIDIDELVLEKGAVPVRLGKFRKISDKKS